MKILRFMPALALAIATLACSLPGQAMPTTAPTLPVPVIQPSATTEPPTPIIDTPALTFDQVANMDVYVPTYQQTVTLAGGVYENPGDPTGAGRLSVSLMEDYAVGDLDGDGAGDIAIMLAENGGGTGTFVSLVVFLNRGGLPTQAAFTLIDDRPAINTVTIADGQINVDAIIHGVDDPMCCPAFPVVQAYRLDGDRLTLVSMLSRTPGGDERIITIDSPADGDPAAGSVRLTGSVTIAPFENNLAYRIYDGMTNAELAAGPCMVSAPDMGAPGTFDIEIPLNIAPSGPLIRIELQDISMADGSLLAMDSVTLNVP